jgi:hypothetical protein
VSEEILFALERAIGQGVGDTALTGDLGRGGGFKSVVAKRAGCFLDQYRLFLQEASPSVGCPAAKDALCFFNPLKELCQMISLGSLLRIVTNCTMP